MIIRPYGSEKFDKPGFETFYETIMIDGFVKRRGSDDLKKREAPVTMENENNEQNNEQFEHKLSLRNLTADDFGDIEEIMEMVYPGMGAWSFQEFSMLIDRFPEGQICIEDKGKVIAAALTIRVKMEEYEARHTYEDVVGKGRLYKHDPKGDALYGIDVFVHPDYRGLRLGRRLYDARKELCEELNLRGIIFGGRIPGYKDYHKELTPQEYIEKVKNSEI